MAFLIAASNLLAVGYGVAPPPEFSRPEVAQILMDYYRSTVS